MIKVSHIQYSKMYQRVLVTKIKQINISLFKTKHIIKYR